ncbi:MAG TPA: CNNM domain-containing protein [Chthoniobacteraceae bacterium]|jgi:CBS domain containing-hemolysin-like protein
MIWTAIIFCLLVSFIFSGLEAGILSVNRVRLKHRVKLRDPAALKLDRLLATPERLLVTVLFVTNLMNIAAIILTTQELVDRLGTVGYGVSLAIILPVYLIGLELLPKSLFRRFPYRALAAFAEPLRIADLLFSPLHFAQRVVVRSLFGSKRAAQQKLFVAREDFKYLTVESERTGAITSAERQMIHNVVDFRGVKAREVMVPLEKVQTIAASASLEELITRSTAAHLERWPVTNPQGEMIGLVSVFDIALDGRRRGVVESYQRRIVKVAANEPAYSILQKLRAARTTLAAVLDSNAKQVGIVTWEDLIKRLVSTVGESRS